MKTSEKLYSINAFISGRYITSIETLNKEILIKINQELGKIIKEIRELEDRTEEYPQIVKEIIERHSRKDVSHYEDSGDIRPSALLEEMRLS